MNLLNHIISIQKIPTVFIKYFILLSLFSINPINIIFNSRNKNSIGIPIAKAIYINSYFDFNNKDRILSISDFGFEKGGEVFVKLDQVVLQYRDRRYLTYTNWTYFSDLYIGVCETQIWFNFIKQNDNYKNNPYSFNKTLSDDEYNESSNTTKSNVTKRSIEEIIIEEIKESNFISNNNIVTIKSIANFTKSINNLNITNIQNKTINYKSDIFYPMFSNEPKNSREEEVINEIPRLYNDTEEENGNFYNNVYDDGIDKNSTVIVIDPFFELLTKANICVNLTSLYDIASDSETFKIKIGIPKDGHYSIFMLKTRNLISMGFDGEITVTMKNPSKYPHFSTTQYNLIKEHIIILCIWMILLLLWICTWINKIKLEIPLAKLMSLFPLINILTLGLETYKFHYLGKNGEHSIPVVLGLAILLLLRTTVLYIGMLYMSKGMYIIRKMLIPDETRSILAITLFTALTDAVFVGLGEGSAIAMAVYKILLYLFLFKNFAHHVYILRKYINQIKNDYKKDLNRTYGKQDDQITRMTYEEIYKLMQPDSCQRTNITSINSSIRYSPNQFPNDSPPPVPERSVSLNKQHNNKNIPNIQIPNKSLNNPAITENKKMVSPNSFQHTQILQNNNQWNPSSNTPSSSIPQKSSYISPTQPKESCDKKNEKKSKKNEIDDDKIDLKRKIISIEENSFLYSKILIESNKNKLFLLIVVFCTTILVFLYDIIFRMIYLPYYYDDDFKFYLIYEGFFIIAFVCYGIILYPRTPKNYIWIPMWVIENTTQPISDNENEIEYMD